MTVATPCNLEGDRFLSDLRYENIVGRPYWWRLTQDLVFESERADYLIVVPAGTEMNLTSIPRPLWSVWPPHSPKYAPGAAVHDYLYATKPLSRRQADLIFRDAMKVLGVPWWQRSAFYFAVRAGGWKAWRS